MQISIGFQTDKPIAAYGPLAAAAEAYGFDGVSVYNDMLYQPAWLPLLEMARHTKRVRLGPAAVNPFTCHPINMAGNIALIDEASQGRAYLGIARGAWLDFLGIEPQSPVTALHEAFECVRRLLHRSTEPYAGKVYKLAGGDSLRWNVYRPDVPFLLGAWGPKTIHACLAEIAEIKIGGTANPDVIPQIRGEVEAAAAKIGRSAGEICIVVGAVTVVDRDGKAARALARREAALYLPIIAALDHTLPLEPDLLARIQAATAAYDFERAAGYISDDLLRRLAFAGTPNDVAEQAAALFEAGAGRIEFGTPHGLNKEDGLRLLGEAVLPGAPAGPLALQEGSMSERTDEFQLYDLAVVVEKIEGNCTCSMKVGDQFFLQSGKISLPEGQSFCLYALQSAIPLLPAKQRLNHPADWMETDARVTCPDPACRLIMRIDRHSRRTLRHDDVSPIAWETTQGENPLP